MLWPLFVAPFAFLAAWLFDRRRRVFADLGTIPAAAVYAGRNEVKGRAWHDKALPAFRSRLPCITWNYSLEEERRHTRTVHSTDSKGNTTTRTETYTQWHQIDRKGGSLRSVHVVDDSGAVEVILAKASLTPRSLWKETFREADNRGFLERFLSTNNRTGRYRETESGIAVGDDLFVVGNASLPEDADRPVIDHGNPFLVSTRPEASHRRNAALAVPFFLLIGSGLTIFGATLTESPIAVPIAIGGLAVLLLCAVMLIVFNQLQGYVQRAASAWSLIDVQLTRRHDLIPHLAAVTKAAMAHEQETHTAVATARGSLIGSTPDAAAVEEANEELRRQSEQLRTLVAVVENNPTLRADATARRLQEELGDTENRIAGARTFYNETVTLLRNKRRTFPGVLIARFADPRRFALFRADGFERTVPAVRYDFGDGNPSDRRESQKTEDDDG